MHPHKTTSNRKLLRRRHARQAWKNYAALEGLKMAMDNDMVALYDFRTAVVKRSTAINVSVSPARVVENPKLISWFLDLDATAAVSAGTIGRRIDHDIVHALLASYRNRRAWRA